jgi:hypothetical protein
VVDNSSAVRDFLPSTSGFRFVNHWPRQPVVRVPVPVIGSVAVGDASKGLCGGMIYVVRDLHEADLARPARTQPPPIDSPLYTYVVRRLIDSFDVPRGVARYYRLMGRPDADTGSWFGSRAGAARATVVEEWPQVRRDLDEGRLSPLGIITVASRDPMLLGENHQVLAYAYAVQGTRVTLRVYDPNTASARADTVTLSFDTSRPGQTAAFRHTIAIGTHPVRAFFRSTYHWSDPRQAIAGES